MFKIKIWVATLRLRTLPLATASILLGTFLAAADGYFRWYIAGLALLTAVLLQILSNVANDYGDSVHGADSDKRIGPKRATQSGQISQTAMRVAVVFFALLCFVSGYILLHGHGLLFYLVGLACVIAAVTYTVGPKPYGYVGLGDIFVFVFFGPVAVYGSYYLQTFHANYLVFLPAAACGLFCVAVLNLNNMRDLHSDALAGKHTIPVRIGARRARFYHLALLATGFLAALIFVLLDFRSYWQFLFLLTLPLLSKNGRAVLRREAAELDPLLRQMAITTLLFALTFGLGSVI